MAAQEKDHTWTVVIGITVIAIAGVLMLKKDETKHLNAYSAPSSASQEAQVLSKHKKDLNNDMLSLAK